MSHCLGKTILKVGKVHFTAPMTQLLSLPTCSFCHFNSPIYFNRVNLVFPYKLGIKPTFLLYDITPSVRKNCVSTLLPILEN